MKKYGWLMKISLLSVSFMLLTSSAISGAIPAIAEAFPEQPLTSIEFITTAPLIGIVISLLISVPLSNRIGPKKTTILGLIIALIGGIAPVILNDFTLIVVSRFIFGLGCGLFTSLAFAMINSFFHGPERTGMLGFQGASQGAGAALLTLLAGQLVRFGWHWAFAVYFAFVPILILFTLFVPEPPKAQGVKSEYRVDKAVFGYFVFMFFFSLLYNMMTVKLPSLIVSLGYGTAPTASFYLFFVQIASTIVGVLFGTIYRIFKRSTITIGVALMGVAYLIFAFSNSMVLSMIAALITGAGFSMANPYMFNQVGGVSSPSTQAFANTIIIVIAQIAGFISPFVATWLGDIPILSDPFAQSFLSAGILALIVAALTVVLKKYLPVADEA